MEKKYQSLKSAALEHLRNNAELLPESNIAYLDKVVEMLVDMDLRFSAYPVLAAQFVARSAKYKEIDHPHLLTMLGILATLDKIKGK